jgi:hypothetical protein
MVYPAANEEVCLPFQSDTKGGVFVVADLTLSLNEPNTTQNIYASSCRNNMKKE